MSLFGFQFFEEQREQQCEQFKELLKDKEEEIQILIQEREKHPQQLDEDEISLLNNQVRFCKGLIHQLTSRFFWPFTYSVRNLKIGFVILYF